MLITNRFRFIIGAIFLGLLSVNSYAQDPIVFTQLTSLQSQAALQPVNLASLETVDGIENIGSALTHITIDKGGYYYVMVQGQAGAIKQGVGGSQYVDIWLVKNGDPVPNSTSRITVSQLLTGTVVTANVLGLMMNDTLSVGFSASDPAYGLIATPAKGKEPAITSVTFTIYKI